MFKNIIAALFLIVQFTAICGAQTRYIDNIFSSVDSTKNIQYCITTYLDDTEDTMRLDCFQPSGDLSPNRPLIVVIHGGDFSSGTRNDFFSVTYEQTFARKGYCVASIDYRTKLGIISISNAKKQFMTSIYNAVQDARSAVRFFKANAETYKIDTNLIFLCGYSAGAITAIQYAHMQMSEFVDFLDGDISYVELLDIRNDLNVSASIKGYISYAGGIIDTSWITSDNVPFLTFHGTNDNVISYTSGSPFGITPFPVMYGSSPIHNTGDRLGINNKSITYTDSTHTFVNSPVLLQQTIDSAAAFLYQFLSSTSTISPKRQPSGSQIKHEHCTPVKEACTFFVNGRKSSLRQNSSAILIYDRKPVFCSVKTLKTYWFSANH